MTVQEEADTDVGTTMPSQKEETNAQMDVEVGIDGDVAELIGTNDEAAKATYTSNAESETTASEHTKGMSKGMSKRMMSMMASSDDPFAIREGKTLLWTNVNMVLVSHSVVKNDKVSYV